MKEEGIFLHTMRSERVYFLTSTTMYVMSADRPGEDVACLEEWREKKKMCI